MIELTYVGDAQTVPANKDVPFNTAVKTSCMERYRAGSSQVTLTKAGRYLVTASGNVALVNTGSVANVGIALNGEVINGTVMKSTPASVGVYNNVSTQTYIEVYPCCCATISLKNNGTAPVTIDNQNLTIVRTGGTNA